MLTCAAELPEKPTALSACLGRISNAPLDYRSLSSQLKLRLFPFDAIRLAISIGPIAAAQGKQVDFLKSISLEIGCGFFLFLKGKRASGLSREVWAGQRKTKA